MQRDGQAANEDGVFARVAHVLHQLIPGMLAKLDIVNQLEVIVGSNLVGGFVRDDDDALFLGLLERGLKRLGVIGDHGDGIHTLGDQVFHDLDLLGRVGLGRASLVGVDAQFLRGAVDAGFHYVEPGDTGDLDHNSDLKRFRGGRLFGGRRGGGGGSRRAGRQHAEHHEQGENPNQNLFALHLTLL